MREPPKNVAEFLHDEATLKSKRWSLSSENDKKELIFFLLQKVFCCSSTSFSLMKLNEQYVSMLTQVISRSAQDRSIFITSLESLFSEQIQFPLIIFVNIKFAVSKIYDSYFTLAANGIPDNYQDLNRVRKLSKLFCKKQTS